MKLFIAIPAYGNTFFTPCVHTLFKLATALERRKWSSNLVIASYADIAESRNALLTHWFDKTDASHMLFLDADMGFEPQLIFDMIEFDKPLVGVIYPKRQIDLDRYAKGIEAGQTKEKAEAGAHDFVVQKPIRGTAQKGFMRVESCGTGIFLIHRSCIELMVQKLPEIVDPRGQPNLSLDNKKGRILRPFDFLTVEAGRLSEDYSFCYRWREKCDGEIWANISYEITHVGLRDFKSRYSDAPGTGVKTIETPITMLQNRLKMKKPESAK